MAKTATKAAPAANVTPSDVPLMPWDMPPGTSSEADVPESLLALAESDEDQPDPSEPEPDESGPDEDEDEDVEPSEEPDVDEVDDDLEDEEPADSPDQSKKFRTKVNGEEVEVTLEELIAGYSRQSDYTRKTKDLQQQRDALSAEVGVAREKRTLYEQRLEAALKATELPEPEWDKLREELEPAEFAQAFAEFKLRADQRKKVEDELERVRREQVEDFEKVMSAAKQEHAAKLLEAIPEWRDEAKSRDEKQQVIEHAMKKLGVSDAEISSIFDYRIWVAMRDSMLLHRMKTTGTDKLREKVKAAPVMKPGVPSAPKAKGKAAIVQARKQLARSGSVNDAAALIAQYLDD